MTDKVSAVQLMPGCTNLFGETTCLSCTTLSVRIVPGGWQGWCDNRKGHDRTRELRQG